MPQHLSRPAADGSPVIVPAGQTCTDLIFFQLLRLKKGETAAVAVPGYELLAVVLSGQADIAVGGERFDAVGGRSDIWSGRADSVYAGTQAGLQITARQDGTEIAVAGGKCAAKFGPFRVKPGEVERVEVGSVATHSRRQIFHILGQNAAGRAGNLLVSELYADPGCWSGYPPHKHDTERPPEETDFQEAYHYRFRPDNGFGTQFCYDEGEDAKVVRTRTGDTFLIDKGYHPTSASPGHEGYIFTILVGRHQRSLIQSFEPQYRPLMAAIPGIQAMRDKFK